MCVHVCLFPLPAVVSHLHSHHIAHMSLTCENIVVKPHRRIVLIDFAHAVGTDGHGMAALPTVNATSDCGSAGHNHHAPRAVIGPMDQYKAPELHQLDWRASRTTPTAAGRRHSAHSGESHASSSSAAAPSASFAVTTATAAASASSAAPVAAGSRTVTGPSDGPMPPLAHAPALSRASSDSGGGRGPVINAFAVDVWAVGVLAWIMHTGSPPFHSDLATCAVYQGVVKRRSVDLAAVAAQWHFTLPLPLLHILDEVFREDPAERPTVGSMLERL